MGALQRTWVALALIGGSAMGCSDSKGDLVDHSANDGALPMCPAHDNPGNSIRFHDSRGEPAQDKMEGCGALAPCQREQISGVVVGTGDGIPPEFDIHSWSPAATRWIKIDDAGHVWTIVAHDLPPFAVRKGSAVSATYVFFSGSLSPEHVALELRVNGELAFYYALGGGLKDLNLPHEVEVRRGAASCESFDNCLSWSEYDMSITVNGGATVTLGTGESKEQVGYLLENLHWAEGTGGGPQQCADAFVLDTTILVARTSPLFDEPDPDADAGADR